MTIPSTDANDLNHTYLSRSKTFSHMVALIQDEIDDTTAEYSTQIQDSIVTALRLCEREPLFFNETLNVTKEATFKTQSGKTWYGKEQGVFIETTGDLEAVFLGREAATQTPLLFKSVEALQQQYGEQPPLGNPLFYTYCDQTIGLFPTPKQIETIRLVYAPFRFGNEGVCEENPWFIHAFDLIKARAKYELYKNILKDPEYAAVSFRDYQEQLQTLRFETSRRKGAGNILSTQF
ncbi:hypothetical protein [Bartonella machadoae]|uniref:hypothetical protein n=1 Tax=Bartonella machadoae TaxID=2893471 RepID=UPI001F4C63F1|nr:hypothetical protein [Bartonella machadoae]UNE53834.1 hypothetical protein LNM86_09525 [Bartonella machadoae]